MKKLFFIASCVLMIAFVFSMPIRAMILDSDVAKIGEEGYSSLYEAVQNAKSGDTIELIRDSEESNKIDINKKLTIIGNGHEIKYQSLPSNIYAISLLTSENVEIDNIKILTTQRGIEINNSEVHFKLKNSTVSANLRGIAVMSDANKNSTIEIDNSIIENNQVTNYDENVNVADTRGFALWDYTDSKFVIRNSTIQGFAYAINIGSQSYDYKNTELIVDKCKIKGRAALNIWSSNLDIKVKDSYFLGINNLSGSSESFANLVLNNTCNDCNINIESTEFTNYQNSVGLNNPNALQYMLTTRGVNNNINISGNSKFIDTTNKIDSINERSPENNNISITGGTYSVDVKEYLKEGYTQALVNKKFAVGPKATDLNIEEEISVVVGNQYNLKFAVKPSNTIEKIKFESSSKDIVTIESDGTLKANKVGEAIIKVTVGEIVKECKVKVNPKEIKQETIQIDTTKEELQLGVSKEDNDKVNEVILKSLENQEIYHKVKENIEAGKEVTTQIVINKITENEIEQEEKSKIEEIIKDNLNLVQAFDINIVVKSGNEELGKIEELSEDVTLSMVISENLIRENRKFYIIRIHNGKAEKIETELIGNILKFNTNQFSTYFLAYEDVKDNTSSEENIQTSIKEQEITDEQNSPKTGDSAIIVFAIIALVSLIGAIKLRNKKTTKH